MTRQRNHSFDVLRLVLAFFIVWTHTDSTYRTHLDPITNAGVPAFLMMSGYFVMRSAVGDGRRLLSGAQRILRIMAVWMVVSYALMWWYTGHPYIPTLPQTALLACINVDPFAGHLWYLSAYAYVLAAAAVWVMMRKSWPGHRLTATLIAAPLAVYFAAEAYYWHAGLEGRYYEVVMFRNWITPGIPCFLIGGLIGRYDIKLPRTQAAMLVTAMAAAAMVEYHWLEIRHISDIFFMTIPLAASLIVLANSVHVPRANMLSECGRRFSLHIYVVHPLLCLYVMRDMISVDPHPALRLLSPLVIFAAALAIAMILDFVKTKCNYSLEQLHL